MKLKFYLRGLGAGIIFTALIFIFIIMPKKNGLTDSQIIEKAKALGLVEPTPTSSVLVKNTGTPTPTEEPTPSPEPPVTSEPSATPVAEATAIPSASPTEKPTPTVTNTPSPTSTTAPTNTPVPTSTPVPTATAAPSATPEPTATSAPEPTSTAQVITADITVNPGTSSAYVCIAIQHAGIIDNWETLDIYMRDNGYDDKLHVGTFTISSDMSFETICRKLSGLE